MRRTLPLAAAAALVLGPLARGQESVDPFYVPPSLLPVGKPGDLIRTAPMTAPAGVRFWRILYHSRTLDDRDIAISGLVAAPDLPAPSDGFPLVSVAHGTTGISQKCTPSLDPLQNELGVSIFSLSIEPFVKAGYAVVVTDYQGLGAPGPGSYLIGEVEGRNVLDAARAIRNFSAVKVSPLTLVWGHSQGGHAAAFAGQLAASYAPELPISGLVLGSPAAELKLSMGGPRTTGTLDLGPIFGLLVVAAWSEVYPDTKPEEALTPAGLKAMLAVRQGCVPGNLLPFLLQPPSTFFKGDITTIPVWAKYLDRNTPGSVRVPVPIFVFQGETDVVVLPSLTDLFVRQLCALGNTVFYKKYAGVDHIGVIAPATPDVLAWMSDRVQGKPASSSCDGAGPRP